MTRKLLQLMALVWCALWVPLTQAATEWSTQDYDLYPGDFDGDGKTDVLYVAKDTAKASGIARSDGVGPNLPFQSWPSNHLGIPWHSNLYTILVEDFNNDDKADLFLQRNTPGDHYLLFADANGKITGISQTVANGAFGLTWSADQHKLHAGDFSGDGRADLFLQATSTSGTHAVVGADGNGLFTAGPQQSWSDSSWGAFKWSTRNSNVFVGDFNGDGKKDLLLQAKPNIVLIDYEIPIPVPTYPPNANGVVLSQGNPTPFQQVGVQQWSRTANGVDWSPLVTHIIIGDFDNNGRDDVLLQARHSSRPSYLVSGNASGAVFTSGSALATNVTWAADSYRLMAGNFDGTGGAGIYYQAVSSAGTNAYANTVTGGSVSTTTHNPSAATGVLPTSAVGHTVGSFAVTNSGAATYSIPIVVPPGVAGVQPALSLNYQSGAGNGLLGVGWNLGGFSEIERCHKTLAQDNSTEAVTLTTADRFCLDGNKLRLTGGAYGAAGSTYQTEIETFSRVTAYGTAGNGPAYFIVEAKNGLRYEYGNSNDSRIEAVNSTASTTPYTWALSKVSDRHGNSMTISYTEDGAPNGSFRPSEISYTSNSSAALASAYKVVLSWDLRPASDVLTAYVAGGSMKELYRLNRIETQYNDPAVGTWRLVRKYQLSYNTSGSTPRSRLNAIQECDRNGYCLAPTTVSWQDGSPGWVSGETVSASDSTALMEYAIPIDFDGDGRDDVLYPQSVSGTIRWHYMKANASGGFDAPINTGIHAGDATNLQYAKAQPIDYFSEGRLGLIVDVPGYSTRQILRWTGSALALTNTNLNIALAGKEWVADFDGDGRADFLYATATSTTGSIYLLKNAGSTATGQFLATQQVYSTPLNGSAASPFAGEYADWMSRLMDFNGDGRADFLYSLVRTDSCTGVCVYTTTWTALLSTGTSFVAATSWAHTWVMGNSVVPIVADFNGDGLTDVITDINSSPSSTAARIAYGSGTGVTAPVSLTLPGLFNTNGFTSDYDSDGRSDLLYAPNATSGTWYVLRSNGSGFDGPMAIPLNSTSANNTVRVLDHDGDGLRDLGYKSTQYRVRKHKGTVPDLAASLTDGFGNSIAITYAPLTDGAVYTKGSGAVFPQMDIQGAAYVVKQYSATDGIGGTYTVTEKYAGLRVDLQGRGSLGFASRESIDARTGIKSTWNFLQSYPHSGFVSQSSTYQSSSGPLIAQVTNTPAVLVTDATAYNDRRLSYTSQSVQDSFEVGGAGNGQAIARVTTTTTLDSYGNPTNATTTTLDMTGSAQSYTSATANTYASADTSNWCLDFVTTQTVTNTVPNLAAQTRTVQFVKDTSNPAACRLYQQIVEPSDNAVKVTTTFGYDLFGHPNSEIVSAANIASRTTGVNYGSQGVFPTSATNALGQVASKTYDYALGVPKTATDPNILGVSWDYDGFGRLIQENRPDSTKTALTYSACTVGNGYCGDSRLRYQAEKRELDTGGSVIRSSRQLFDAFGRSLYSQSQTLSGAFSNVATLYDNLGRPAQQSQPYFSGFPAYFTTVSYDLLGRPTQEQRRISEADAGTQTTAYAYHRLIHTQTDANGKTTTQQFNALGQVVRMTDAANGITQYEYDPFGNLKKTIDPSNNQIVNSFNLRGFKTLTQDPDMGLWSYTYYPTGELWTQTDAKNQTVTFTYDALSRPSTRVEPEGTTSWAYGTSAAARNIGKLQSVSSPGGYSEAYAYDSLGRLQDATTNAEATSFVISNAYNSTTGFLDTVTYPTSTSAVAGSRFKVKYEYESGLLKRARDFHSPATIYWEQVTTNAAGQTIDEQYGNGLHSYSSYDSITGFLGTRTAGASSQVQNLTYQWDKVGNLKQRKDNNLALTEDFNYDNLYRLDDSKLNGVTNLDMSYNALGNITSKSDVGSYTYPASGTSSVRPHAVSAAGSNSFVYDANGNMISRNASAVTWTSYNLPNRIDKGSNYSQFFYGADRSRYKQVAFTATGGSLPAGTETTVYVGGLFEKVTKPSGVIEYKHYVLAGKEPIAIRTLRSNSTNDTRYLHKDHLGSVDAITNESGGVVQRLSYDAFGKRRNATAWAGALGSGDWTSIAAITHRGFTFHEELDNVDLVHMNGRVYDPNLGRFISADPFIQAPLMSQSLNRYSYVMNNPLSLVDPSGYSWLSKAFRSVGKFFKKYWREIVAVVVTVVSMGTLGPIVGAAGGFWGAVAVGATAGAIYGASVTALYGGNLGDIFRGALTGAIAGGISAGIGYGMGFSTPGQPGATEAPTDFGWKSLMPTSTDVPAANAANTGINPAITRAISAASDALKGRRFATEAGAARALHDALSPVSARYNIEIGAFIYRVPGRFGHSFVVGEAYTEGSSREILNLSMRNSLPTISQDLATTIGVSTWHTHPGNYAAANDFSDKWNMPPRQTGDVEGYVLAGQNGYVSLVHSDAVLMFNRHAFEAGGGEYSLQNRRAFTCVVSGSHRDFAPC